MVGDGDIQAFVNSVVHVTTAAFPIQVYGTTKAAWSLSNVSVNEFWWSQKPHTSLLNNQAHRRNINITLVHRGFKVWEQNWDSKQVNRQRPKNPVDRGLMQAATSVIWGGVYGDSCSLLCLSNSFLLYYVLFFQVKQPPEVTLALRPQGDDCHVKLDLWVKCPQTYPDAWVFLTQWLFWPIWNVKVKNL